MVRGRPVIGITAAIHPAAWTVWRGVEANVSPRAFTERVAEAGALPLLLPAEEASARSPGEALDLLDALVLSGGADIDPSRYRAAREAPTQEANAVRDSYEAALAAEALARDMPVLGICRGMEMLNVVRGGTLEQHLAEAERHLHTPGQYVDHDVRLEGGSLAARALGAERVSVRSHHHQGIAELGDGLVASGWSEPDGVVEAIEMPERRFVLGLLWHAEEDAGTPVVAALAAAARSEAVAA